MKAQLIRLVVYLMCFVGQLSISNEVLCQTSNDSLILESLPKDKDRTQLSSRELQRRKKAREKQRKNQVKIKDTSSSSRSNRFKSEHSLALVVGNRTTYQPDPRLLRQNRYHLNMTVSSRWSENTTTVVGGNIAGDPVLRSKPHKALVRYDEKVSKDEGTEQELRVAYLDVLGSWYRLKLGLQKFDWAEHLVPDSNGILTVYDLRFGLFENNDSSRLPVAGLSFNHMIGFGTLDWFLTPLPVTNRLPKGPNGYGYYERLQRLAGGKDIVVEDHKLPITDQSAEGGVRLLLNVGNFDFTLLSYWGHLRSPSLTVSHESPTTALIEQDYPRVTTHGFFSSIAGEAYALRIIALGEPRRPLPVTYDLSHVSAPVKPSMGREVPPGTYADDATPIQDGEVPKYQSRYRVGLGFDYVSSRHLKFYSEHFATRLTEHPSEKFVTNYQSSLRLTNETFDGVLLTIDSTFFYPHNAQLYSPRLEFTLGGSFKVKVGANLVRSNDDESEIYELKKASEVYLSLAHYSNF